jgi:hypothetical protein
MRGRRLEKTGGVAYYTRPPQARQDALLPRGNTLRIFSGRERRRCLQIVCRSRMALLGQTPRLFFLLLFSADVIILSTSMEFS